MTGQRAVGATLNGNEITATAPTPVAAGNAFLTAWLAADMDSLHANTTILSGVLVKFGPNVSGPSAVVPGNIPGGAGGAQAPPNLATLVRKNTGQGGRRGSGRMFIPGLAEGSVDVAGNQSGAILTAAQVDLDAFVSQCTTLGVPLALLSGDGLGPPLIISSLTVQSVAATQRRRMRR